MNNSIEQEIIRLVKEIAKDELDIREAETRASRGWGHAYTEKAESITRSLERKFAVLRLLQRGRA